jgi:antitoxin component YwqK of YwqJK toxin-antitoxin module/beta-lactamase regulating signal transducer with metallopeptidase domain
MLRRAQPHLLVAWLAGVCLLSGRLLASLVSILGLARRRCRIPAELAELAANVARRLRLRRVPRVFSSERVREAVVVGFWRPVVLLPLSWLAETPPAVLEAVIAHELAHIRRWDVWANLLQRLVETLLFYHPAVWWLSKRVSVEREMCADELAVAATQQPVAYAEALHSLASKRLSRPAATQLTPAIGGDKTMLLNRVRNILGLASSRESTRWWPVGLLTLLVPLGLVLSASVAETEGQPETFQVERTVKKSSWDEHGQVFRELVQEASQQKGADPFAPPNQATREPSEEARRLKSAEFAFRQVFQAYRDPNGEIVRHGPLAVYHPDGNRLRVENWKHGKLDGKWTDWRLDGRKLAEGVFQDGKKTGRWLQYDRDGAVDIEEEYNNGQPVKFVAFANAPVDSPANPFADDRASGRRYRQQVIQFRNGLKSSYTVYWPNGKKRYERLFKAGVRDGLTSGWYESGAKQSEVAYSAGKQNGLSSSWYESGAKQFEGQSDQGREVGRWTWWSEAGVKEREAEFRDGLLVDSSGRVWPILDEAAAREEAAGLEAASRSVQRIAAALDEETVLEFLETPLRDVVDFLRDSHGIPIVFDGPALQGVGVKTDTPVTMMLRGISLRGGLQLVLAPLGLAAVYRHEVLVITTLEDRKTWRDRTGVAELKPPAGSRMANALSEETVLGFINTPLQDILPFLRDSHGIKIQLDRTAPASVATRAVTLNLRRITLQSALFFLLEPLDLRCDLRDDVLVIRPVDGG